MAPSPEVESVEDIDLTDEDVSADEVAAKRIDQQGIDEEVREEDVTKESPPSPDSYMPELLKQIDSLTKDYVDRSTQVAQDFAVAAQEFALKYARDIADLPGWDPIRNGLPPDVVGEVRSYADLAVGKAEEQLSLLFGFVRDWIEFWTEASGSRRSNE